MFSLIFLLQILCTSFLLTHLKNVVIQRMKEEEVYSEKYTLFLEVQSRTIRRKPWLSASLRYPRSNSLCKNLRERS